MSHDVVIEGWLGGLVIKPNKDGQLEARVPLVFELEEPDQARELSSLLRQQVRLTIQPMQLTMRISYDEAGRPTEQPPLPRVDQETGEVLG